MPNDTPDKIVRFSVSLESSLVKAFEKHIRKNKLPTRSEALRLLIKKSLIEDEWLKEKGEVVGVVSLIYDHHRRGIVDKLIDIQHLSFSGGKSKVKILASLHIHLDHDNCLEVITVSGNASRIKNFYTRLKSVKGLKHISLTPTSRGKNLG